MHIRIKSQFHILDMQGETQGEAEQEYVVTMLFPSLITLAC